LYRVYHNSKKKARYNKKTNNSTGCVRFFQILRFSLDFLKVYGYNVSNNLWKGIIVMETIKKYFPLSFGIKSVVDLVIKIIIYLVISAIVGVLINVLSHIPVINLLTGLAGALLELYILIGIILAVLDFFKIIK